MEAPKSKLGIRNVGLQSGAADLAFLVVKKQSRATVVQLARNLVLDLFPPALKRRRRRLLAILQDGEALCCQRLSDPGFVSPEHHCGVTSLHKQGHEHGHQWAGDVVDEVDMRVPVEALHPVPHQWRQSVQHLPDCRRCCKARFQWQQLKRIKRLPAHENFLVLVIVDVEPVKIIIEDRMVGDKPRLRYLPHKVVHDDHLLQHRLRHRKLQGVHRRLVNLCPLAG